MSSLETIINLQRLLGRQVYEKGTDYVIIKESERYKVLGLQGEISDYYTSIYTLNSGIYAVSEYSKDTHKVHFGFMRNYHKPKQWFSTLKIIEGTRHIVCNWGISGVNILVYDYNCNKVYETDVEEYMYVSKAGILTIKNCIDNFIDISVLKENSEMKKILTLSSSQICIQITEDSLIVFDSIKQEFTIYDMEGNILSEFKGNKEEIEYHSDSVILRGIKYTLAEML